VGCRQQWCLSQSNVWRKQLLPWISLTSFCAVYVQRRSLFFRSRLDRWVTQDVDWSNRTHIRTRGCVNSQSWGL
jgi:hypothetical protein